MTVMEAVEAVTKAAKAIEKGLDRLPSVDFLADERAELKEATRALRRAGRHNQGEQMTTSPTTTIGTGQPLQQDLYGSCPLHLPDSTGRVHRTVLTLERSPERTVKIHWWHLPDERPHSHPWAFRSEILAGGYTETRYWVREGVVEKEERVYRKGDFNDFPALHPALGVKLFHSVYAIELGTVSRLVTGPLTAGPNDWGYLDLDTGAYEPTKMDPRFRERLAAVNPHLRLP